MINHTQLPFTFSEPGSPEYIDAARSFNAHIALQPAAAATARTTEQVRAAVASAVAAQARIAPLTTGHSIGILADDLAEVHLLRTEIETPVILDRDRQVITVPAGALWGEVVSVAASAGFAVPHGSSPGVGVVGYLLGGGLSFYGRRVGVASNLVESITIVLADGEERTVDAHRDGELFWALRGGGGGFGVVTSIDLRMMPMTSAITGMIVWDAREGREVAEAWRRWTSTADPDITTSLRLMNLPPIPGTPSAMLDRQVLVLDGAVAVRDSASHSRAERVADDLLAPLRRIADPLVDTWHTGPVTDVTSTHNDPAEPLPYASEVLTVQSLDEAALTAWWDAAGPDSGSSLVSAELRQLGGAFAANADHGGVLSRFDGDAVSFNLAVLPNQAALETAREDLLRVREATEPFSSGLTVPTFVEDPRTPRRTFSREIEEEVDAIRARVDPGGVFARDVRRSHPGG